MYMTSKVTATTHNYKSLRHLSDFSSFGRAFDCSGRKS